MIVLLLSHQVTLLRHTSDEANRPNVTGRISRRAAPAAAKGTANLKTKTIAYWATTILLAMGMLSGGAAELMRQPQTLEDTVHLGYPPYFLSILGFWKVLGAIALLAPHFPRLKEWAYAGVFFDVAAATASHLICRDAAWHVAVTSGLAVLTLLSWAVRPQSRRLGELSLVKAHQRVAAAPLASS
jgi:uncharacterized membrane protein YphA (DoxX/SURF4 family)